ncbi:hypothetical protein [Streptomyces sp. NPDC058045]|uniref:hypothetical protein n=1 Tax=Streptomyces sp. NPDC058045 TaxID=3346311 RepID=UPI0036F139C4
MNLRRSAAVLAAAAVLATGAAPAAVAAGAAPASSPSPAPELPAGLYGTGDPTYDGVFRQSYALLAQRTAGVTPAKAGVDWLLGQQCGNGGFAPYRPHPEQPCDKKTQVDSNSTAAAVQALAALGKDTHKKQIDRALSWLTAVTNKDGGWGFTPGLPSDANSTGIVVGAISAAGSTGGNAADWKNPKVFRTPGEALVKLAMPCAKDGAFGLADAKTGKLTANADATAAGVLGSLGRGQATAPGKPPSGSTECGKPKDARQAAVNGAAYLHRQFAEQPYLISAMPGAKDQPDYGNTADAVVALAAAGRTEDAAAPLKYLKRHGKEWAAQAGPAAWAQLVFAAHATGTDPRHFGSTDLVAGLNATGPAPESKASSSDSTTDKKDDGNNSAVWWISGAAVVVLAAAGGGFLAARKRRTGA